MCCSGFGRAIAANTASVANAAISNGNTRSARFVRSTLCVTASDDRVFCTAAASDEF